MSTVVSVENFGVVPNLDTDATPAVWRAIEHCRTVKKPTLVFPKGRYRFRPDRAREKFHFIANNDDGLKRVVFPLAGLEDITVDGQDSEFLFHGMVTPFVVEDCRQTVIKNMTIDWAEPLLYQGTVLGSAKSHIDLQIPETYPYKIRNNELLLTGEGWSFPLAGLLEMDPQTGAPAYRSGDHCGAPWHSFFHCEEIGPRKVRISNTFAVEAKQGNAIVLASHTRHNPAIFITESADTRIEGVTIHQAPAMAIIAQRATTVSVHRVNVLPRPGSGRLFSASADATHFVNCRGRIEIVDCTFECQLDDATNVHGIYGRIEEVLSPTSLLIRRGHSQQKGATLASTGDRMQIVKRGPLLPATVATVTWVSSLNADFCEITFDESIARDAEPGDLVENLTWAPDVVIRNCVARNNRARGFLIQTPGRVLVEHNTLGPGGAAILVGGEGDFWFESGAVKEVMIRNNTFQDCNYGPWSRAVIDIAPSVRPGPAADCYHANICIESNTFRTFEPALLYAFSAERVFFRHNTVHRTTTYAPYSSTKDALVFESCANIDVRENRFVDHGTAASLAMDKRTAATAAVQERKDLTVRTTA